jgi:hypothetical protein
MMLGGQGKDLSVNRLLANCASAMAPRQDVVGKMHHFLKQLDETRARYFEALITDDRAAHYLMRRTLGDARLITQANAIDIYEEVFLAAGEKAAKAAIEQKEKEYAERDAKLKQEIEQREAETAEKLRVLDGERLAAEAQVAEARSVAAREREQMQAQKGALESVAEQERALRLGTEQDLLMTCLHKAKRTEAFYRKAITIGVLVALFLVQLVVVAISGEWGKGAWITFWILAALGVLTLLTALAPWNVPDRVFGAYLREKKREAFEREVGRLNAYRALESFKVDLSEDRVEPC